LRNSLQSECRAGRTPPLTDNSFMFLPLWTWDTAWTCSNIQPATKYVQWQDYRQSCSWTCAIRPHRSIRL